MKSISTLLVLAVSLVFSAPSARAEFKKYTALSDRRADIRFPDLTQSEKELILRQVNLLFRELFVHREHKIGLYGSSIDPLPLLDRLQTEYASLSSEQFHARVREIFVLQRDLHTNYNFPAPFACYATLLPFDLTLAKSVTGAQQIVVKRVLTDQAMLEIAPSAQLIGVGDVLVEFNGKEAFEAARDFEDEGNGSNPFATLRDAVSSMGYLGHRMDLLPDTDTVRLRFKRALSNTFYTIEMPWISRANEACLNPPSKSKRVRQPKILGTERSDNRSDNVNGNEKLIEKERLFREHLKKPQKNVVRSAMQNTAEPILTYKMIQQGGQSFAVVRLASFVPEKLSDEATVLELKRLLENDFKDTTGLLFDVRNNGGGSLWLADRLVQLFVPLDVAGSKAKLLSSEANRFLVAHPGIAEESFRQALDTALANGSSLTAPVLMTPDRITNDVGQAYFKPVAILTNSSCYSACDTFTAQMQDHGAAVVFGEDGATGGGGANVWKMSEFYKQLPENDKGRFELLPQKMDMRTAWRQSVRVGRNSGRLIEDHGVTPDAIVAPIHEDLIDESNVQFSRMATVLARLAPAYEGGVKLESRAEAINLFEGDSVHVAGVTQGTDSVEFYIGADLLGAQKIEENGVRLELTAPGFKVGAPGTYGRLKLVGLKGSKRVWRKFIDYRSIPAFRAFNDGDRVEADLTGTIASTGLTVFTKNVAPHDGWRVANGKLRVGDGNRYIDNVDTEASYFLDLTNRASAKLKYAAEIHTEEGYDYFTVSVNDGEKTVNVVEPQSGDIALKDYEFDLTPFKGKKIEIRFSFKSDSGVIAKGVEVGSIVVE